MEEWKIDEMYDLIQQMHHLADELKKKAGGIQAVERNLDRILANIKMLELNICDVKEVI
jgi:predicted component of type VI protein secretion system